MPSSTLVILESSTQHNLIAVASALVMVREGGRGREGGRKGGREGGRETETEGFRSS